MAGQTDSSGYLKIALGSGGTISGDQTFTGNVEVQGNFTFGDAQSDIFDINGVVTHTPVAATSGATYLYTFTGATDTGLTASTERPDYHWNGGRTVTWATGALANQRQYLFEAETVAFAGASTLTNAATVYIDGAPAAGTNATITNAYALWVDAGTSRFDGAIVAPTSSNTINGLIINSGALSGISTISTSGNVGIGTAAGTRNLYILDNTITTNHQLFVESSSITSGNTAYFYSNSVQTGNTCRIFQDHNSSTGAALYVRSDGAIAIEVAVGPIKLASGVNIIDANNNELIKFTQTGSAVNEITITNAASGTTGPIIAASGETNVDLQLAGAGTGKTTLNYNSSDTNQRRSALQLRHKSSADMVDGQGVGYSFILQDSAGTDNTVGDVFAVRNGADNTAYFQFRPCDTGSQKEALRLYSKSGAVNYLAITPNSTGNAPSIAPEGTDTNISLVLTTKGTGVVSAASGIRTKYSNANVSDPPTDAELDSAFGDPTVVGSGFVGILDDNDAGTDVYICFTTGTAGEWFYVDGTKAV